MFYNRNLEKPIPSQIRAFAAKVASIPGALNFTIGEPDMGTDDRIKAGMIRALEADQTHYAPSNGTPILIDAIVEYFKKHYDATLRPEQMIITNGASEGIALACHCLLNQGEQILIPSPFFPAYELNTLLAGAEPVFIDTSKDAFKVTPEALEDVLSRHPKIRLMIFNYPSNPTGASYTADEIKALAEVLAHYDVMVLSDEIYADLTYEGEHYSFYNALPEQVILLSGVSKNFAMTGFRVGFIHVPERYYNYFFNYHQSLVTCVSTPDQYAAAAAYLECEDFMEANYDEFKRRRDILLEKLPPMGLELINPDGAFYLFGKVPACYAGDDEKFTTDLLEEVKVGVVPGSVFGVGGEGYYRFSYASSYENIVEAIARLETFMASRS